jgi:hypothetical protein
MARRVGIVGIGIMGTAIICNLVRPWRIRHLDEVLGHICARQGVWKATGCEIIDWFKAQSA